MSSDNVEFLI